MRLFDNEKYYQHCQKSYFSYVFKHMFIELLKTDFASHIGAKQETVETGELQLHSLITDNSLEICFPNVENAFLTCHSWLPTAVENAHFQN